MKKIIIVIFILINIFQPIIAQNLTNSNAKEFIYKFHNELFYSDVMNRFVDDENFNRPILYAIPTVFEEAKNDERLRSKCMSLLSSIFSTSKNKEVKSTAVTIALDLAKIESIKSTVESYIYEVFALKMNAIDFNEQIHFKLIELLKSENKDYSMWLLRLVSKSNDKTRCSSF